MKKILIICVALGLSFLMAGCATDKAYGISKAVYQGGKVVVKKLPISEDKKTKLKKLDKVATTYDKARTAVRTSLNNTKKN